MTRPALALLAGALVAAAVAYGAAFLPGGTPAWAAPLLAVAAVAAMVAVALLAVGGRGWSLLTLGLAAGGALLAWALGVTWLMPPADPAAPELVGGLPFRAAHLLYGVGLVPALVVPLLYAWTFDRDTLGEEALERFRREAARLRGSGDRTPADPGHDPGRHHGPRDAPGGPDGGGRGPGP